MSNGSKKVNHELQDVTRDRISAPPLDEPRTWCGRLALLFCGCCLTPEHKDFSRAEQSYISLDELDPGLRTPDDNSCCYSCCGQ